VSECGGSAELNTEREGSDGPGCHTQGSPRGRGKRLTLPAEVHEMSIQESDFPFPTSLSLEGLIGFWRQLSQQPSSPLAESAAVLLARVEATPAIRGRISDPTVLDDHKELLEALMAVLFPVADRSALGGTGEPFGFKNIYETPATLATGVFSEDAFQNGTPHSAELMRHGQIIAAYQEVLLKAYGVEASLEYPLLISLEDPKTGLRQHYQVWWDSRFLEVRVRGSLPQPSEAEFRRLLAEPTNIELWMQLLPPERFELGGLGIVRATDVTMREAISRLKDDLLEQDAMATGAQVDRWQVRIRTLLGSPDVQVGLIAFDSAESFDCIDASFAVGRSLLLSDGDAPHCPVRDESNYAEAFRNGQPVVVSDLEHSSLSTGLEQHLVRSGYKSLLIQPLFVGERLVGLLEVASPTVGELTAFSSFKLTEVAQPFATALQRSLAEREDKIQSVIKQQYTAIHPSVEWRFREAAAHLLRDDAHLPEEIVFRDVYPLYGLSDIRGSSDTRSVGIQADLVEQLRLALTVLQTAGRRPAFPVFDQIGYRIERFLGRIEAGLHSEDETAAIGFLSQEFEPLLEQLSDWGPEVAQRAQAYSNALDSELGVLYRRRKAFDTSVATFNDTVSHILDEEEAAAQAVFPHFFEKFKTDGVDYNIYIGDSLSNTDEFSKLYLHNLRLWQLRTVARIEWELERVRPTLGVDLPATQLILVQDQPLAIRFRIDEKRFDVDGAYNIRYELVKKRIDKARIRDTGERLTQPGTLAVVYSQTHEGQEYRRYLEYLASAGYYEAEVEDLVLEDMQGVIGLKALRVAIDMEAPRALREAPSVGRLEELQEVGAG